MLGNLTSLETVERLIRRGDYCGPLVLNYVAIGGGAAGLHPADMIEFARRTPDGAVLTIETLNRNVVPMNTMAIALGLHVRVGIEDTLFGPDGERASSVRQVEQMVRIARELHREVASGEDAHRIYRTGTFWSGADETLAHRAWCPTAARRSVAYRCARQPDGNPAAPRPAAAVCRRAGAPAGAVFALNGDD